MTVLPKLFSSYKESNMKKLLILLFVAMLAACGSKPIKVAAPLYDKAEYDALPTSGTGILRGQAFLKTKGGDVKKGAGNVVLLRPATNYAKGNFAAAGRIATNGLYGLSYDRTTISDGDGKFEFKDLPPGEYFVVADVTWSVFVPGFFGPRESVQGGQLAKIFTVENNKTTEAILTK